MKNKYRILRFFFAISLLAFCLNFSLDRFKNRQWDNIQVSMNQSEPVYFLDEQEIVSIVKKNSFSAKIGDLDTYFLRKKIKNLVCVDSVNVYMDLRGTIHVDLEQRIPKMRITDNGKTFYIDKNGKEFSLSKKYSHPCMLVSGAIPSEDYLKLLKLVGKINKDEFYRDFFVGITKGKSDYYFLTNEGTYIIEIGDLQNLDAKLIGFKNFFKKYMIYQHPLKYQKISLKYANQIVANLKKSFVSNP